MQYKQTILYAAWQIADTMEKHVVTSQACNSEALSYARTTANDPTTIAQYFDLLEHTMEVHGLTHRCSK